MFKTTFNQLPPAEQSSWFPRVKIKQMSCTHPACCVCRLKPNIKSWDYLLGRNRPPFWLAALITDTVHVEPVPFKHRPKVSHVGSVKQLRTAEHEGQSSASGVSGRRLSKPLIEQNHSKDMSLHSSWITFISPTSNKRHFQSILGFAFQSAVF